MLNDLVKTKAVLKEKLKNIKLNQVDRVNLLEDTFQPITKPLTHIIKKLEGKPTNDDSNYTINNFRISNEHNNGDDDEKDCSEKNSDNSHMHDNNA